MVSIDKDARRRAYPGHYRRSPIPFSGRTALPPPIQSEKPFSEVLSTRRSGEYFRSLSDQQLANFLAATAGIRQLNSKDPNCQRRYVASMGALHPAHIILYRPKSGWFVYVAEENLLGKLSPDESAARELLDIAAEVDPQLSSTLVVLLSDLNLAENYYEHCVPLLLRDAGVLLGHASLVAGAYQLNFRILGRTGVGAAERLVPQIPFSALATGLAVLGGS